MMTAFIIAVRGTVAEAALLRQAATVSHRLVVSVVGLIGIAFRRPIGWRRCGTLFPDGIGLLDHRYRSLDACADLARATAAARRSASACASSRPASATPGRPSAGTCRRDPAPVCLGECDDGSDRHVRALGRTDPVLGCDHCAGAVPSGKPDLARCRLGLLLQHRTCDHADRSRDNCGSKDAPFFAPLVEFRPTCAARAIPLQHPYDRPRALRQLAGLDERSQRSVAGFSTRRGWPLQITLRRIK